MQYSDIFNVVGYFIYGALGAVALYGLFCVVLLVRRISQKRFASNNSAEQFLGDVRDALHRNNYDAVTQLCDSPPNWSKAVPQLILVAVANRSLSPARLRRLLAERFEREVLADLEYRTSWIATMVKIAPMLGLLGTVLGMISAFGKIAVQQQTGSDPTKLAGDISFALFTTAIGLLVAIPLVTAGAMIHVRIGKLQDSVQDHLGAFLDDFESGASGAGRP